MSNWKTVPFWSIARRRERSGYPDKELLSVYRDWGVVRRADRDDNFNRASEDLSAYKLVEPGNLVLNKMKTWQGSLGVSDYEGIVSPAYFVCELSSKIHGRFAHYLLRSQRYIAHYEAGSKGIRTNQWDLPYDVLRQIPVVMAPIKEQRRIADFLDDRVSRIDRIIAARGEQLSKVAEWQQSQLSHLMDRQAASFGIAPLRRFCAGIEQGASPVAEDRPAEEGECGVLKTSAILRGTFFSERYKSIQCEDADSRYRVQNRDVIITRGSGSADLVGDAAAAVLKVGSPPLYLSDLTYRLKGLEVSPEYAVLAMISARGRSELGSRVRQGSGPAKARGDDIMAIPVPTASPAEQLACVNEDASLRKQSAVLISGVTRSIDLLTEYKASLITAAVTGELDVTTAGSKLPG